MRLPMANPIFVRVMTTSGRKRRHVWVRGGYLLIILITLIFILLGTLGGSTGVAALAQLGESLFAAVSYSQLILILFLSPIYTAGAITQERDAQTFSVLLATPLSNFQIVFGSLVSRLFFVLAILFSTLPIFALLYYFGGFELKDVILSYSIAATSALLTGSVAIALSITTSGARQVMVGFFLFIVIYLLGVWTLDHIVLTRMIAGYPEGALDWLHPVGAIQRALATVQVANASGAAGGRIPIGDETFVGFFVDYPEYGYLIYSVLLSAIIITLAAVFVRRLARGYGGLARRIFIAALIVGGLAVAAGVLYIMIQMLGTQSGLTLFVMSSLVVGLIVFFLVFRRHNKSRTVWDNPIAWRERVTRTATAKRTVVLFLYILFSVLTLYAVLFLKVAGRPAADARGLVLIVTMAQMFVMLLVGATMASSCISYEREQGTLDILLTTPITPHYFIFGKLWGIVRYLFVFWIMIFAVAFGSFLIARLPVDLYLKGLVPERFISAMGSAGSFFPWVTAEWYDWPAASFIHPLLVLGGMAAALATIGMTFSLRAKSTTAANLWTALVVMGSAALLSCCCGGTGLVIPMVGPPTIYASPFLAMLATLTPQDFASEFNLDNDATIKFYTHFGRHAATAAATVCFVAFAWVRLRGMVRTFDQQTRQKV